MTASIVGPPWFRDICAGYLAHLARKGRRPKTLLAYRFELLALGRWLDREGITDVEQLTGSRIERWQDFRAGEVVSKTQQVSAAAVRGALRWAATQEPPLCAPTLWLRLITPRTGHLLPRPIPRADLDKLLDTLASREPRDLVRLRTRALFLLILTSGARISEALSLDRGQLQGRTASVIQKGGSEKLLVISRAAELAIADYLEARTDDCPALFGLHRFGVQTIRLGHQGAQWQWTYLCEDLGIKRYTSHQIRHSCATELLRQHVDSLVIAKHMGHRGLQSIQGYAEVGLDIRQEMLTAMDERNRGAMGPMGLTLDDELARAKAAYDALRIEDIRRTVHEVEEQLAAMTPAERAAEAAEEQRALAEDQRLEDEERDNDLERIWLQLRWNHDATGAVTREELETFARLTGHADLIREAAMTGAEFRAHMVDGGGLWPLTGGRA